MSKMENKTKTCGECRYFDPVGQCEKVIEYNLVHPIDEACEFFEPKVITNGDRIRQMSNEELAEWFALSFMCDACLMRDDECTVNGYSYEHCRGKFASWLNFPAKSEVSNG